MRYRTIVADPPWPFVWDGGCGGRRARKTELGYETMSIEDIAALAVGDLAENAARLYLWVLPSLNREGVGVQVARAWGFEPHDEIIWEKPNFGMGKFPRRAHEIMLVCRRGNLPFRGPLNISSVQRWKQRYDNNNGKRDPA